MSSETHRHSRRRKAGSRKSTASKMTASAAFLLLLLSVLPSMVSCMGVISIDYGTAFMKAALVKPGMPFDVVLSRDSKRKGPSVVGGKKHERLFGADAENAAGRFPDDVYAGMKLLLGRSYDNATVLERQSQLYGTNLVPAPQRPQAIAVQRPLKTQDDKPFVYSVEEIVGMQLSHMKQLAEATAREEVKVTYPGNIGTFGGLDVVVTVPGYYTAQERQAIYDASQLAGMKPRLVSDGAAGEHPHFSNRLLGNADPVVSSQLPPRTPSHDPSRNPSDTSSTTLAQAALVLLLSNSALNKSRLTLSSTSDRRKRRRQSLKFYLSAGTGRPGAWRSI